MQYPSYYLDNILKHICLSVSADILVYFFIMIRIDSRSCFMYYTFFNHWLIGLHIDSGELTTFRFCIHGHYPAKRIHTQPYDNFRIRSERHQNKIVFNRTFDVYSGPQMFRKLIRSTTNNVCVCPSFTLAARILYAKSPKGFVNEIDDPRLNYK